MTSVPEYNLEESKSTEQAYLSPEIVRQRRRTIELMAPLPGERILDVGCGPGLLALELSVVVGDTGKVLGIDSSPSMIELAKQRCADLDNVVLAQGDATDLAIDDNSMDVVCCTQVLLYVAEYEKALSEMFRVLKPGGRVLVLETDWRSTVLHSNDEVLTEKVIEAWDKAVPSPRLPARLGRALRSAGFDAIGVDAIPNISTTCEKGSFSMTMMEQCALSACEQGTISKEKGREWIADLVALGENHEYFLCVNRFLFSATKPGLMHQT
jgi:arsenite methyltransferase